MTTPNRSGVGSAATRVMLTLLELHDRNGTVTGVDIATALQLNKSTVHGHLRTLKRLGFVDWQPGRAGTLRPTAQLVPLASGDVR